ncbi:hypothetical protein DH2020_042769 [Rehmannia glutinosa]|uniref:mitogen-activated protein kinase kinase n=1 Tax=Rehmannia glutinosa TaxID=99300 RepID=A0ABR0UNG4_REHGL
MAGLEELKKKLVPLFDAEKGFPSGSTIDPSDSYMLSDGGTVNLLSKSYNIYNINELGLQKCSSSSAFSTGDGEKTYRCASHEMRVFGSIGSGASSVVQRAIHIPNHRIIALKKINIFEKGLSYLHGVRHLVHRDIKPANLLVNLKGEPKITDFGISAGLEDSMAMCATFVGTVTYMSPERIRNESYSYPADIWSLGLALFECATGEFPYTANEGPVNLMLQILDDPSPSLANKNFSPEFCSFVDDCLQKDPVARPTAEKLLSHPFIKKYEDTAVNLEAFVQSIFDPTQRLKDLADDIGWKLAASKACACCGKTSVSCSWSKRNCTRVSGSFIVGNQFLICGDGAQVEGLPNFSDLSIDIPSKRVGTFREQFILETSDIIGRYFIAKQELYIVQ